MIVRIRHPDDPDRHVFAPLRYDRQRGTYVVIKSNTGELRAFSTEREAQLVVFEHARAMWSAVLQRVRVIRVLSEHESFSFSRDGIDDEMVRNETRDLTLQADLFNEELRRLFSQPRESEQLELDVAALRVVESPADK